MEFAFIIKTEVELKFSSTKLDKFILSSISFFHEVEMTSLDEYDNMHPLYQLHWSVGITIELVIPWIFGRMCLSIISL